MQKALDYVLQDMEGDARSVYRYPLVASDLLSQTANPRVIEFFALKENDAFVRFKSLFFAFKAPINLTRASYAQKIIQSLLNAHPALFFQYLVSSKEEIELLFGGCQSRSVQGLLLAAIIGPNASPQMGAAGANPQNEKELESIRAATLPQRTAIVKRIFELCLEKPGAEEDADDNHSNMCVLAASLFIKDYADK